MNRTPADGGCSREQSSSRGLTFSGKPLSLMHVMHPTPPSPYKPQRHIRGGDQGNSIAESFLRGRKKMRVAARAIYAAAASIPNSDGATKSPGAGSVSTKHGLKVAASQYRDMSDSAAMEDDMFELLFHEAQRHYCVWAEEAMRSDFMAREEVIFSKVVIEELQCRAKLISGDKNAALVIKAAEERAIKRQAMMERIEKEVSLRLRDQRLAEFIALQFKSLIPAHKAGRERIIEEEANDLHEIFRWQKENRPLRGALSIQGPARDYRLVPTKRNSSRTKSSQRRSASQKRPNRASTVQRSLTQLSKLEQQRIHGQSPATVVGPLATTARKEETALGSLLDGTLLLEHELAFQAEGRARLREERNQRYAEVRYEKALKSLQGEMTKARQLILAEQTSNWMQITSLAMDGFYAARKAKIEREEREAIRHAATAQREAEKDAVKERMLAEQKRLAEGSTSLCIGKAKTTAVRTTDKKSMNTKNTQPTSHEASHSVSTAQNSSSLNRGALERSNDSRPQNTQTGALSSDTTDETLAHLRLVTGEIGDRKPCKQLTALTEDGIGEAGEGYLQ